MVLLSNLRHPTFHSSRVPFLESRSPTRSRGKGRAGGREGGSKISSKTVAIERARALSFYFYTRIFYLRERAALSYYIYAFTARSREFLNLDASRRRIARSNEKRVRSLYIDIYIYMCVCVYVYRHISSRTCGVVHTHATLRAERKHAKRRHAFGHARFALYTSLRESYTPRRENFRRAGGGGREERGASR